MEHITHTHPYTMDCTRHLQANKGNLYQVIERKNKYELQIKFTTNLQFKQRER